MKNAGIAFGGDRGITKVEVSMIAARLGNLLLSGTLSPNTPGF
jgi:hypothetical protein